MSWNIIRENYNTVAFPTYFQNPWKDSASILSPSLPGLYLSGLYLGFPRQIRKKAGYQKKPTIISVPQARKKFVKKLVSSLLEMTRIADLSCGRESCLHNSGLNCSLLKVFKIS